MLQQPLPTVMLSRKQGDLERRNFYCLRVLEAEKAGSVRLC